MSEDIAATRGRLRGMISLNQMKKRTIIIILGIWIAIIPVLGLPNTWKNRIVSVSALVVVYLAYSRSTAPKNIAR